MADAHLRLAVLLADRTLGVTDVVESPVHDSDKTEVVRAFETALQLDPTLDEAHFNLGLLFQSMKEHPGEDFSVGTLDALARKYFRLAYKLNPLDDEYRERFKSDEGNDEGREYDDMTDVEGEGESENEEVDKLADMAGAGPKNL